MSIGLANDIAWTKDYEPWQFAYCFRENPNMDKSVKNHMDAANQFRQDKDKEAYLIHVENH